MKKLLLLLYLFISSQSTFGFQLEDGPMNIGDRVKPDTSAIFQLSSTTKGMLPVRMTTAQRDAIATPAIGLEIFNTDDGQKQFFDGITWTGLGSANIFFQVTQVAHGRTIGFPLTPVYLTGGVWTDAKADAQTTLATHVIIQVIDANTFVVAFSGRYTSTGHGLTVENHYFVSEVTAGLLTLVEPAVYSNPVIFVEDVNTIHITAYRAFADSGGGGPATVISVFGRNGSVVAVAGDYTASEVTNVPAGNIAAVEVQAALDELDTEKQVQSLELDGISALATTGLVARTAAGTYTPRTLQATSTKIALVNPDGVAGNPSIDVDETNVDHDNLTNFVLAEHIDWTASTSNFSTTGTLAAGTSTITGNLVISGLVDGRDVALDGAKLDGIEALADVTDATNVEAAGAVMDGDFGFDGLMVRGAGAGSYLSRSIVVGSAKVTIVNGDGIAGNPTIDLDETAIDHDNLLNFVSNEHINHSSVLIDTSSLDDGLFGGGDLTSTRTLNVDLPSLTNVAALASGDYFMFFDISTNFLRRTTLADIVAAVPVAGEANTASNLGAGAQLFSTKVGVDLRFRSITAGSTKATVTQNANDVAIDVNESNIGITNLAGFNADNYLAHSGISMFAGVGLTGGGNISADRTFNLDWPGVADETVVDATDTIVIYDQSAGAHREMARSDFLTGIVAAPVDSVFGRTGVVVAATSDYGAIQVDNTPAGTIAATNVQAAINELDGDIVAVDGAKEDTITGAATTITGTDLTINRALLSNGSGKVAVSAVTSTELGHVSGVTSAIQTQLDAKLTFPEFIMGFGITNVNANSTTPGTIGNNPNNGGYTALRNGEIYGVSIRINNTRSAGTLTAFSTLNGVTQNGVGESTVIDAGNTQGNFQVIASPIQYNAGDNIGAETVTVGFAPTGSDAVIVLYTRDR